MENYKERWLLLLDNIKQEFDILQKKATSQNVGVKNQVQKSVSTFREEGTFFLENITRASPSDCKNEHNEYRYVLPSPRASKHLWKCAIEYHTFFRLVKTAETPEDKGGLLKFGSRFRYSGRTLHQAKKDDDVNSRKSMMFKRTRSERFAQRSTIGYIRIGSQVWAKAVNGDYYRGLVTALTEKVHVKFESGDTISHDRKDEEALVYDMDPNPNELKIGTRVIAHWSGLSAFLSGNVTKIDGSKYHVLYDDGDKGTNRLEQMRILKPPLYFGPGSGRSKIQKKYSMKTTALIGGSGGSSSDPTKGSTTAEVNRPRVQKRNVSEDGDDDVFNRSPAHSPRQSKSHGKRSSPNIQTSSQAAEKQRWTADINKGNLPRSQSMPKSTNNNYKNGRRPPNQKPVSLDTCNDPQKKKHAIQNVGVKVQSKDSPPLAATYVHNPKTGAGYQITDL